jgi:hypothetical protein
MVSIPATSGASPTDTFLPPEGSSTQPDPFDTFSTSSSGSALMNGMTDDLKSAANAPSTSPDTNDVGNDMLQIKQKDPDLYNDIVNAAAKGDGNTLATDIDKAYKNNDLSKGDASQLEAGVQQYANDHGGGKINKGVRNQISSDFGSSLIQGGHERSLGQMLGL